MLVDDYLVYSNNVWGYGRRLFFMIELDYEFKGKKSLFSDQTSMFEEHRMLQFSHTRREIKKGFFSNERNITQAL